MGVRTIAQSYQTLCYQALECGRTLPNAAERMAILLESAVANTTLASSSSKIDIIRRECKQVNGYGRRRLGRIVSAIATGTYTSAGHGMSDGDIVFIAGTNPGGTYTAPTGITLGTPYFVVSSTADTFRLALTAGGSALTGATSLPTGITVAISAGTYDATDRRHESAVETVRFIGTGTTGYPYGGFAVIRGGHAQANTVVNNFNQALNQITITAGHNLVNGDEVFFSLEGGAVMPSGITALTTYFARSVNTTTFSLHPTAADATGGTNIISLTTAGSGTIWLHYSNGFIDSWETFATSSTLANGEEQPFALNGYFANIGNSLGLE